jgi:hypothetical protein
MEKFNIPDFPNVNIMKIVALYSTVDNGFEGKIRAIKNCSWDFLEESSPLNAYYRRLRKSYRELYDHMKENKKYKLSVRDYREECRGSKCPIPPSVFNDFKVISKLEHTSTFYHPITIDDIKSGITPRKIERNDEGGGTICPFCNKLFQSSQIENHIKEELVGPKTNEEDLGECYNEENNGMKIQVIIPPQNDPRGGEQVVILDTREGMRIREIKAVMFERTGIPIKGQELLREGMALRNSEMVFEGALELRVLKGKGL